MVEMLLFVFGVYAFVFGSIRLPWDLSLVGWRARIAGLFLMAPLPILIYIGVVVSEGVDNETAMSFYGFMEVIIIVIGILGAAVFAYLTRPKSNDVDRGA